MTKRTGQRILVVEDEALIAIDLEAVLEDAGYRVLGPVNSAATALALLERELPELALLDVNLGGSNVFGVANAVAARNVPIIFLTGHTAHRLPENHRHRPLVAKPYLPSVLLKEVERVLLEQAVSR